jgi:hypothetical protein
MNDESKEQPKRQRPGSDLRSPQIWIALAGLIVAIAGVMVAYRALGQQTETEAKRLLVRASFKYGDHPCETGATELKIRVTNVGADPLTVESISFLAPDGYSIKRHDLTFSSTVSPQKQHLPVLLRVGEQILSYLPAFELRREEQERGQEWSSIAAHDAEGNSYETRLKWGADGPRPVGRTRKNGETSCVLR